VQVNGADIFSRGADVIPMEEMEGRQVRRIYGCQSSAASFKLLQTAEAYISMLQSGVAANFNTLVR
jgi:hypothetical protein